MLYLSQLFHSSLSLSWLFSLFSVSVIRLVSSVYLRLLIFLPEILIPACASSSPAFHMVYSACRPQRGAQGAQGQGAQPGRPQWGLNVLCASHPLKLWKASLLPCLPPLPLETTAVLIKSKLPNQVASGKGGTPQRGGLLPRDRKGRAEEAERGRGGRRRGGDCPLIQPVLSRPAAFTPADRFVLIHYKTIRICHRWARVARRSGSFILGEDVPG